MRGLRKFIVWAAAVVPAMVAIVWLILSIDLPLGRDQGIFAWVGATILRGGLPYVDAWEHKGPGAHALYALALWLFGETERGVRLFDLMFTLAAIPAFLVAGWRCRSPLAGVMGILIFITAAKGSWWDMAQPDGWAGIMLLWSTVILLGPDRTVRQIVVASLLIGAAALIKPFYVLFGVVPLVWLWQADRAAARAKLFVSALIAGFLPIGAALGLYLAVGHLPALWDALVEFNLQSHVAGGHLGAEEYWLETAFRLLLDPRSMLQLIVAIVGFVWLRRHERVAATLIGLGTCVALLCAILQVKIYRYHLLPYFEYLALLGGFGVAAAAGRLVRRSHVGRRPTWFMDLVALAVLAVPGALMGAIVLKNYFLVPYALGRLDEQTYLSNFNIEDFNTGYTRSAAKVVRDISAPNDPIYVWGYDALAYFLANRPSASRFGFNYPLVLGTPDYVARARQELMVDLARSPPKVIVIEDHDVNNLLPRTSRQYLGDFPELKKLIDANYVAVDCNWHFIIYELKSQATKTRDPATCP